MKKIAVITGASSGMGREMVFELADRFRAIEEIWVIACSFDFYIRPLFFRLPVNVSDRLFLSCVPFRGI